MLMKLHASITAIHNTVGEKEAGEWVSKEKDKKTVAAEKPKTPQKKPKRVNNEKKFIIKHKCIAKKSITLSRRPPRRQRQKKP